MTVAKVYTFALYGRSEAGKSCILTALSMALSRRPNPRGYQAAWVPDPPEMNDPDLKVRDQYREGQTMLERAQAAMEAGDKPPPSPLRILRYRFDFTVTKPSPRTYPVELIDYSGELIDPKLNAEAMARELRSFLASVDGLFVLAEAPPPGGEGGQLHRDFDLLQRAFALLAAERESGRPGVRTPVVLMLNKWDRLFPEAGDEAGRAAPTGQTEPGGDEPQAGPRRESAERAAQVDRFLNGYPEPPHRALANYLEGAVADGCFTTVAVSAFGKARTESRTDKDGITRAVELPPRERPLPAFGLEDGFVWAARCRDEIDLDEYDRRVERLGYASLIPWLGLDALNPLPAAAARKTGVDLAARFPRASDDRGRALAGANKALRVTALRWATVAAGLALALFGAEAGYDLWRFRQARAELARPDATLADLARHQARLEAYLTAPDYRHAVSRLLSGRAEAAAMRQSIFDRRHATAVAAVKAHQDVVAQEEPARNYLREFESGPFAAEAIAIVHRAGPARRQRENEHHLDRVRAKVDDLGRAARPARDEIAAASRMLEEVPHQGDLTEAHARTVAEVRQKCGALLAAAEQGEGEERFRGLVAAGKFEEAGAVVQTLRTAGADTKPLAKMVMSKAEEAVNQARDRHQWALVRGTCGQVRRGWVERGLLDGDQVRAADGWMKGAYRGEDADLYADVLRYRDATRCRNYLESTVPGDYKRMKDAVTGYLGYLERIEGKLDLTLELVQIEMGSRESYVVLNMRCVVAITGDPTPLYDTTGLQWKVGEVVALNQTRKMKMAVGDEVSLDISLVNVGARTDDDLGRIMWKGKASELKVADGGKSGKVIELPLTKHYNSPNTPTKVLFKLWYIPDAPDLPTYSES
jgi:hypothetical protein